MTVDQIRWHVRGQVYVRFQRLIVDPIWDQVGAQVRDKLNAHIHRQTWDALHAQVRIQAWQQIWAQESEQTRNPL